MREDLSLDSFAFLQTWFLLRMRLILRLPPGIGRRPDTDLDVARQIRISGAAGLQWAVEA